MSESDIDQMSKKAAEQVTNAVAMAIATSQPGQPLRLNIDGIAAIIKSVFEKGETPP